MDLIKKLQTWKKDLEDLGTEKSKAEGRYEQGMTDLKNTGFDSLEDAKIELARREQVLREAEIAAQTLLEEFKIKYADHIS